MKMEGGTFCAPLQTSPITRGATQSHTPRCVLSPVALDPDPAVAAPGPEAGHPYAARGYDHHRRLGHHDDGPRHDEGGNREDGGCEDRHGEDRRHDRLMDVTVTEVMSGPAPVPPLVDRLGEDARQGLESYRAGL